MPVGDDNSDRRLKPIVNYLLIPANIFVFIFFQGLGTNEKFTYSFSTVPQEIVSGEDIVTEDQMYEDSVTGERFRVSGLQPTPYRFTSRSHFYVYARRICAYLRQHAFLNDIW